MPRRKIRDEQDARNCLTAASQSGLARAQWARTQGIDARSLNGWRVALERRDAKARSGLTFAEMVPPSPLAMRPVVAPPLRICVGHCVVEVPVDFNDDHLRRVLGGVSTC